MLNWNRGLIQEGGNSKRWRRVQKSLDALYLHFQTFIYSERAQSWTKYISVSNAFCLTAPSFVSETEACRMFKQLFFAGNIRHWIQAWIIAFHWSGFVPNLSLNLHWMQLPVVGLPESLDCPMGWQWVALCWVGDTFCAAYLQSVVSLHAPTSMGATSLSKLNSVSVIVTCSAATNSIVYGESEVSIFARCVSFVWTGHSLPLTMMEKGAGDIWQAWVEVDLE